jgi:hypothetical protein
LKFILTLLVDSDDALLTYFKSTAESAEVEGENGYFSCNIKGCNQIWEISSTSCCKLDFCNNHRSEHDRMERCCLQDSNIRLRLVAMIERNLLNNSANLF